MALTVNDTGGGDFEQAPIGTFIARCVRLIDLGTQHGEYQGKATVKREVMISWELPSELMTRGEAEGKPFLVARFYTASLGEKANLRHDLEAWRGRAFTEDELAGFDLKNILGKACMVGIIDKGGKSRIGSVMALPRGMEAPPRINEITYFDIDEWNDLTFDKLSKGIQDKIKASDEYKERNGMAAPKNPAHDPSDFSDFESDIPFN